MARIKARWLAAEERRRQEHRKPSTLADLAEAGVAVFCWCNRCGHNATLETSKLIDALGAGYPIPEVGARLRCRECRSKNIATRPAWPGLGQVTSHAAATEKG